MPGFLDELIPGFVGRQRYVEERNRQEDADSRAQEGKIYEALLNSSDPHVQSMALSGLFESAMPNAKAKGLKGFLGERQKSPLYQQLTQYIKTPVTETTVTPGERTPELPLTNLPGQQPIGTSQTAIAPPRPSTFPAAQPPETLSGQPPTAGISAPPRSALPAQATAAGPVQPTITAPPSTAFPAAQSGTSPVQGGPPPRTTGSQPAVTAPAPTGGVVPVPRAAAPPPGVQGPPTITTSTHPRQIFDSPEETTRKKYVAESQGQVEGRVAGRIAAGFTREQALELERRQQSGYAAGNSFAEGEIVPDQASPTGWSQILYLRSDPTKQQRIPAQDPSKANARFFGQDLESISREPQFGGKPYGQQTPEMQAKINAEKNRRDVTQAGATTRARGDEQNTTKLNAPLSTTEAASQSVPFGTSMATLAGITPVTEDQRKRRDAAVALAPQISEIAQLVQKVFPPESGLKGGIKATEIINAKRLRNDPDLALLESKLGLAVGNVSRVLAAETGRLTEQDVTRAQKSLVDLTGFTDTQESAMVKLQSVEDALQAIRRDMQTPGDILKSREAEKKAAEAAATAPPATPAATAAPAGGTSALAVDQTRMVKGQWMRITAVHPDGSFDAEPLNLPSKPVASHPPAPSIRPVR